MLVSGFPVHRAQAVLRSVDPGTVTVLAVRVDGENFGVQALERLRSFGQNARPLPVPPNRAALGQRFSISYLSTKMYQTRPNSSRNAPIL